MFSDYKKLNHGVSKGTVLGPLNVLFNRTEKKFSSQMTQVFSVLERKVAYLKSQGNFTENRRICKDEPTNFENN